MRGLSRTWESATHHRITVQDFPAWLLRRLAGTGAKTPPVRGARRWARVLIRRKNKMSCLVGAQSRIVLLQSRSRRLTGVAAVPNLPAHVVTVFQCRRSHSADAGRLHGSKEVRRIGVRARGGT